MKSVGTQAGAVAIQTEQSRVGTSQSGYESAGSKGAAPLQHREEKPCAAASRPSEKGYTDRMEQG